MNIKLALQAFIEEDRVFSQPEECLCYAFDATNMGFVPEVVVFPVSAYEVSDVLKFANENRIPVTPRGAGTGYTGGALSVKGGILISFEKMNRILDIQRENLVAIVEPGVITQDLKTVVEQVGLFCPIDPASLKISTIGGNVAECAGGPTALKYGVTRDYVLGLELVTGVGTIIKTGAMTMKHVVGYDLTRLIVGSEGTLGIVTKIFLKLLPLPRATVTAIAMFASSIDAAHCISTIFTKGVLPRALEFMDKNSIRCVRDYLDLDIPPGVEAILILEVDGVYAAARNEMKMVEEACKRSGTLGFQTAVSDGERTHIWRARRAVSPAIAKIYKGMKKINEDIVVPRNKIPHMIDCLHRISEENSLDIVTFGHAGDGNLHVNIMVPENGLPNRSVDDIIRKLFTEVISVNGSISGEHGIGITKSHFINMELGDAELSLMKSIKNLFDPNGILNPFKVFPQPNTNFKESLQW